MISIKSYQSAIGWDIYISFEEQQLEQRRAMCAKTSMNDPTIPPADSPSHPKYAHSLYSNTHSAQLRCLVIRQSHCLQDACGIHHRLVPPKQRLSCFCRPCHQVYPRPVGVLPVRKRPRFCVIQLPHGLHLRWSSLLVCAPGNMILVLRRGGLLG
jgi:hypothetical protein